MHDATSFWPILKAGLFAPEYSLKDVWNVRKGASLLIQTMEYDVSPEPNGAEILKFEIPIVLFLGRHDFNTPSDLASNYLNRVEAPLKKTVWFEESAHFPFFEEPDRFHSEMLTLDGELGEYWSESGS